MAVIKTLSLPDKSTFSEQKVFALLRRLDDQCLVYYEPFTSNRHPDFIVVIPDLGVLVIEAKGWKCDQIIGADGNHVTLRNGNKRRKIQHPHRQARDYMHQLRNKCWRHKWAEILLSRQGPYEGNFTFPFTYVVIHTEIARNEFDDGDMPLSEIFPPDRNVTKDIFDGWLRLSSAELKQQLRPFFNPYWRSLISPSQIEILKAVIDPVVHIPAGPDADLRVLDKEQEDLARQPGPGHRIVYGAAGSGKTVILLARARFIAGAQDRRVLILCFNRLLSQNMKRLTSDYPNIEAYTFHAWGLQNRVGFIQSESQESHAERLLEAFERGTARHARRFDAVLVDEAQLLPLGWLKAARLALKEPSSEHSHLFITGDGTQQFFRSRQFSWADAGVQARGRTRILKRNYRNTVQILAVAYPFAAISQSGVEGGPGEGTPAPDCFRQGPKPLYFELDSREDECRKAINLVRSWLTAGVKIRDECVRLQSSEICILYPRLPSDSSDLLRRLQKDLSRFTSLCLLDNQGTLDDDGVRIVSIRRATGLQF